MAAARTPGSDTVSMSGARDTADALVKTAQHGQLEWRSLVIDSFLFNRQVFAVNLDPNRIALRRRRLQFRFGDVQLPCAGKGIISAKRRQCQCARKQEDARPYDLRHECSFYQT